MTTVSCDKQPTATAKIPPEWLSVPRFTKRSDLLNAPSDELHRVVLEKDERACNSPEKPTHYGIVEKINRDTYRKSGVFEYEAASPDPKLLHERATCSGSPTRTALFTQRLNNKRLESLAFEPLEVMRLRDIPKPGAPELEYWWTKTPQYVEDPTLMIQQSLRLHKSLSRQSIGPVDPAKITSPRAAEDRRNLKHIKTRLVDKITQISHEESGSPNSAAAGGGGGTGSGDPIPSVPRAAELRVHQHRRQSSADDEANRSDSSLSFQVSPINTKIRASKRSLRHVENLFVNSTNQRMLLDQIKLSTQESPSSTSCTRDSSINVGMGARSASSFLLGNASDSKLHSVKDYRHIIRCSGFS